MSAPSIAVGMASCTAFHRSAISEDIAERNETSAGTSFLDTGSLFLDRRFTVDPLFDDFLEELIVSDRAASSVNN
jgi:hypothetical protein